uniref:Uncharacterized protein n=1 Tax=Nelumbo nucifera TaxID=4432 RepID=A0A822ZNN8_NELNU|nr:TPA_asm: hypothetical protein HUJ06_016779 [Nelumbo nucifera]
MTSFSRKLQQHRLCFISIHLFTFAMTACHWQRLVIQQGHETAIDKEGSCRSVIQQGHENGFSRKLQQHRLCFISIHLFTFADGCLPIGLARTIPPATQMAPLAGGLGA